MNTLVEKNSTPVFVNNEQEISTVQQKAFQAFELVDNIVMKNYLTILSNLDVAPINDVNLDNIILFKINKMVYEKNEYATDKFISVVSSMTYTDSTICMIIDGHKDKTDFYLGVKCEDSRRSKSNVAETFKDAMVGQFPGAMLEDCSIINVGENRPAQDKLLNNISKAASISSCVGVPSYKNQNGEYTNENYIQGLEKFANAMQGKTYTAIILASNLPHQEVSTIRSAYENIYSELSALSTQQLGYSTNESLANAISRSKGISDTDTQGETIGKSTAKSYSTSNSSSTSVSKSHTVGESKQNKWGKIGQGLTAVGGVIGAAAFTVATGGLGAPVLAIAGAGAAASIVGAAANMGAKTKSKSDTTSISNSTSQSATEGTSTTESINKSKSSAHTESFNETTGETSTIGSSKNFTLTIQNKKILEIQKRIDKQLERIEIGESTGLWSTSAYFVSYGTDRSVAETGATIFRSIMQGEQSGVECSAINTWYKDDKIPFGYLKKYISSLSHPIFSYADSSSNLSMDLVPTSLLSSKEVAMMVGLPRKSVPGLPVVEYTPLAKEVVRLNSQNNVSSRINIGCIFDQGITRNENAVWLDTKSLTQHTLVTGSTGCGKSNTIYYLIDQLKQQKQAPKFLVIEPAKGEYKDVFGNEHVYGTNPLKTPLLRINPFKFPEGVHVLEHIDRLIEIFNVCWPMYAAMPAVLKEAILSSYENCGWDLYESKNKFSSDLFPTFKDLLNELNIVINNSAYSDEVKSNYQGSLITRVKSLNNGICKQIFSSQELGDQKLFDENVIVDLSRIGSQETKSLIMGILIIRLNEYRSNSNIPHNSDLKHVTILEEAHNLLKRDVQGGNVEGNNIAGKSVEMITNSIAEMRTYGEGFIIVDQSPGAIDISAIRNTNTKIIMRLPEESDRMVSGKASGMKDSQIDEIAKLPTGVAVIYQNDWEEPVLCKIGHYDKEEIPYKNIIDTTNTKAISKEKFLLESIKLLLKGRTGINYKVNTEYLQNNLADTDFSTSNKTILYSIINDIKENNWTSYWEDSNFKSLSRIIVELMSAKDNIPKIVDISENFQQLTKKLNIFIKESVPNLPPLLAPELCHCMMYDYSIGNIEQKKIFSAWYSSLI